MALEQYIQPVAVHEMHPERLLLRDVHSRWYLWTGEEGTGPQEIPARLGQYLMNRSEMDVLACCQRMWFLIDDLPLRPVATPNSDGSGQEYFI